MVHYYNTTTFETRIYDTLEDANKYLPDGFIPYTVGQEPQDLLDFINYKSPEQIAEEAKALKIKQLSEITVTTSNSNVFDGDDTARADMNSAINASAILGQTTSNWKLADNTFKVIDITELQEALALSIQEKGKILGAV